MAESENPLDKFPDTVHHDIEGLRDLGYLDNEVSLGGHHFWLRTLRGKEELYAAKAADEYMDTLGQAKAWAWAHVGMSLMSVDGNEDFCPPIGHDPLVYARARFDYVTDNWYWPTGEYLFGEYSDLVRRQAEAFEAFRSLSERSLVSSSPGADSLIEQAPSNEPTAGENPPST